MDYMNYRHDSHWVMPYLGPGESILWQGRPQRANPFTSYDLFMIPFSIFWCGGIFRTLLSDFKEGLNITDLFLMPFILVGLYLLVGRFILRWYLLRHTDYAITTRKILRRRNRKVDVQQSDSMPPFRVKEHRNGLKSILFKEDFSHQPLFGQKKRRPAAWELGFALEFLSDAERALRAIDSMRGGITQQ